MFRRHASLLVLVLAVPVAMSAQSVKNSQPFAEGNFANNGSCQQSWSFTAPGQKLLLDQFTHYNAFRNAGEIVWQITVTTSGNTVVHYAASESSIPQGPPFIFTGVVPLRLYADGGTTVTVSTRTGDNCTEIGYSVSGKTVPFGPAR
jgi:hypothetical protein